MRTAVHLLAAAGILAVLVRMGVALLVVLHGGAEGIFARDLADSRAQRGDITGLQQANVARDAARRRRWRGMGIFSIWAGLLFVPPLTPWPALLYAAYSVLWLVPRRPLRRGAYSG